MEEKWWSSVAWKKGIVPDDWIKAIIIPIEYIKERVIERNVGAIGV